MCTLNSSLTKFERPFAKVNNLHDEPMSSNSNCVVNFVEVLHDCMPRCIDLKITFKSHSDNKLYLQVIQFLVYAYQSYPVFNVTVTSHNFINES